MNKDSQIELPKEFLDKVEEILERVWTKGYESEIDRIKQYYEESKELSTLLNTEIEQARMDGKNEYYFDSPEYLVNEAHSLACTLAQRWNENNYNQSMKSFKEEQASLSNKLVSVTKKIKNAKKQDLDKKETDNLAEAMKGKTGWMGADQEQHDY